MLFNADVVKILIASPSDVLEERTLAREVIHELNTVHADDRKIVLLPIGWETNSTPAMGDRPQAILNKQLLDDCDLLVAIFWTRLGSPTGEAASGTVEEIEEHLGAGKPAMIYFSSAPVPPGSVDDQQYSKLRTFRDDLKKRALIYEYGDAVEFRKNFARHLAQTIIRQFTKEEQGGDVDGPSSGERGPALSASGRELLLEAAQDPSGFILRIPSLGGTHVQTNGRNFAEFSNARSEAQWRGAVDELHNLGFVEDRGGRGEAFSVTHAGYRAADVLGSQGGKT